MRPVLLFFVWFILSYLPGNTQTYLGIKQGANLSKIIYEPRFDQGFTKIEYLPGYTGGVALQIFTEKFLGLQLECLYNQKGFRTAYDTLQNTQYERRINYLSVPIYTHFYFSKNKSSLYLLLGVFGSVQINSREYLTDFDTTIEKEYNNSNEKDNYGEFGLGGGIGIKRHFTFGTLQLDIQYQFSLSSIYRWGYNESTKYFTVPEMAQNQQIQAGVYYLIPIKKQDF